VHKDGYSRRALAEELHLGRKTVQRWIIEGLLEVRDPRITEQSLNDLRKTLRDPAAPGVRAVHLESATGDSPRVEKAESGPRLPRRVPTRSARAKFFWAEAAQTLGISLETVEQFIASGLLKLQDPRVTEKSLRRLCRRYGSLINYDFLDADARAWLRESLELFPAAGEAEARRIAASRKHAKILRKCAVCGRMIRGNAYFRHIKNCRQLPLEN
jgi:hypothetical protein